MEEEEVGADTSEAQLVMSFVLDFIRALRSEFWRFEPGGLWFRGGPVEIDFRLKLEDSESMNSGS